MIENCLYANNCSHIDCDKDFCLRKYKLDNLYSAALLTDFQKKRISLKVDEDGTDLEEFKALASIEKDIVNFVNSGANLYIHSSQAGNGKAQPDEALIFCANGYKTMQDVKVNDLLFGEDGNLHKIIGKFDRGTKSVYKVTFHDGTSTECCNEHLWTVYDHIDMSYKTITLDEIIKIGLNQSYATTRNPRWRFSIPITKTLNIKSETELSISPYLLGYLLGDGHLGKDGVSIAIQDKDAKDIIPYLQTLLPAGYCLAKTKAKYSYDLKIAAHSGIKNTFGSFVNEVKQDLKKYALLGTTSYTKFIPNEYKLSSIDNRLELLRGLMDTDGTVSTQKDGGCQLSFSTVSKQLAEDFAFIVESLGGTCSIRERKGKSYTYKNEKKYGHTWYNCTLKLPKNICPFRLNRKANLYNELSKHTQREPYRTIRSIEYIGQKHCYCIMTDNPTHLYLTNNLIVTHNTSWATRMIQSYINKIWLTSDLECRALFISVPRFLLALKDNISNRSEYIDYIKENILKADLVVWDELGSKIGSEFELNHLLNLIDNRITAGKSNVYTSNLNKKEMFIALGERLTSRITNYSKDIELHGADKRGIGGNN